MFPSRGAVRRWPLDRAHVEMNEAQMAPAGPTDAEAALAELSMIVLGDAPLGAILGRVSMLAVQAVAGVDEASVTLVEDDEARTVGSAGSTAPRLDERQYENGWGPCLDAAVSGHRVVVDTEQPEASPYPDFAATAQRAGIRTCVAIGLPVTSRVTGALNLYSRSMVLPHDLEIATLFAAHAAVAVANAALYSSTAERADNLVAAMRSRATIEQAKGIVMSQQHCDADAAFAALVRASQTRNLKLRDVAAAVVEAATAPDEDVRLLG